MSMIRVSLSEDGIQGYYEGCGCCGGNQSTNVVEIRSLYTNLENQKQELSILLELLGDYSEELLVAWFRMYEAVRRLQADEAAGIKYSQNKNIEGTWYKDCFDRLPEIKKQLKSVTKEFSKTPSLFRKYMKVVNS